MKAFFTLNLAGKLKAASLSIAAHVAFNRKPVCEPLTMMSSCCAKALCGGMTVSTANFVMPGPFDLLSRCKATSSAGGIKERHDHRRLVLVVACSTLMNCWFTKLRTRRASVSLRVNDCST